MNDVIAKISENIKISEVTRYSTDTGFVQVYVHPGSSFGSIVLIDFDKQIDRNDKSFMERLERVAKDICMQIAVTRPLSVSSESLDSSIVEKEKEIAREQMKGMNKPPAIMEKILDGKIKKFYKEVCLLEQPFIKDDKISVKNYLDKISKELGVEIRVVSFSRLAVGSR